LASESASSAVLDGDGVIGASTGMADTQCITAAGTSLAAERFTTGAISTAAESRAAARSVPGLERGLSRETGRRLADTLHLVVRAAYARARSAATIMVESQGAIRHAEGPAWVAGALAEGLMAAAVVDRTRSFERRLRCFPGSLKIWRWR
jgi:hypothetical protein